jgi:redox-sensitive bicupin YhaK (pirin superfamily)
MAAPSPPKVRIVAGEIQTQSATTRLVLPTVAQPAWPPFLRVAETIASRARPLAAHPHEHEEVLTLVSEGFASYQLENETPQLLRAGSARLLTSPARSSHRISPAQGGAIRWFNLVAGPIAPASSSPRLQASEPTEQPRVEENTLVRPLVGPGAPMSSGAGLEVREVSFVQPSATFQRVGHDRRAVVYAFSGHGSVDGRGLEAGEAALAEGVAAVSLQGSQGLRAVVATAPRLSPS